MFRRKLLPIVAILIGINANLTFAQAITGKLMSSTLGTPLASIALQFKNTEYESYTNGTGNFSFLLVPNGKYDLVAFSEGNEVAVLSFDYNGGDLNLGVLQVEIPVISTASEISLIDVTDLSGTEGEEENFSSVLAAGRDAFTNSAAYNLGAGRFRIRGYNNEDSEMLLNGMLMNDQDDGRVLWNAWSGLNDVLRNQTQVQTLSANDYTFGGVGGATFVDLRAAYKREGTRFVYSLSNRTFTHRIMATHATGMMKNGWAFTGAASYRFGPGYIEGTDFKGTSYFLSVDRKLSEKQTLNFVVFGAPQVRGRSGGAFQELYDITGSNFYNSFWGYQNGKVRNSREYRINQPVAMLRHDINLGKNTSLMTTIGYQWGTYSSTGINWLDAPNPFPDYYRKLPSYHTDSLTKQLITDAYQNDVNVRQLDWDAMYQANYSKSTTINDVNGIPGNSVTGKLAAYVLEEQHFDNSKLSGNALINHFMGATQLTGGAHYLREKVHYYQKIDDLLGADFFIDFNRFASRDFPGNTDALQNDLNNPNRLVREGDIYGYNYNINTQRYGGWAQVIHKFKLVDVFAAASVSSQSFYREGLTKVGLFPDNSFGKSKVYSFLNYGLKGGVTYKLDGRNYFVGNASYTTRAPFANETFISPRTRDQKVNNITSEKILATEIAYLFRYAKLKGRISAFYTKFDDRIDNQNFFHDDLTTFVNYVMTDIDRVHQGLELGIQYQIDAQWSLIGAGNLGQYYYTSRPLATISRDNSAIDLVTDRQVYINNYYWPTLQEAATFGINHRNRKYWFLNANINYFGRNYLSFNPDRRTTVAVDGVDDTQLFNQIIDQEKFPTAFTVDVFCGKSRRFKDRSILAVNLSISNIFNNTNFRTGGFEQLRFDYEEKNVDKFPPRYFYSFGTNFNLGITYTR
jgi:hypothetical protein